ncbi:hypothetical protein MasN3_10900 [Massilia varians]|uniref:Uncharacterized protein n=2 Tax=Massilia varians TaxID=457921 RepID=A0ABN6TBL3_9BURK|nr:hypothetical protein MasN3_10900 [Massilia varians]
MPGTTTTGTVLFAGINANPRILKSTEVVTDIADQPPLGKGSRGCKGRVGSGMDVDGSAYRQDRDTDMYTPALSCDGTTRQKADFL